MQRQNTELIAATSAPGNRAVAYQGAELAGDARDLATFSVTLNPIGPIERFLVEELGRRATETRGYDAALDALRREGEAAFLSVLSTADGNLVPARNLARASVLGSERHEALMRQGLASARGFLRALRALHEVRATCRELGSASLLAPDPRFATEQACAVYLARRYFYGACACRRCGAVATGSFVAARGCWQCARCHAQTGLRCGTCMERSALPLTKWFATIRIVLLSGRIRTEQLAAALKIDRQQTVRSMINRIRAAASAEDPSTALAGLDELYLGFG